MIISLICALTVIGVDQLTKFLVFGTASRSIIGNFVWFESTLNTGVAFSMFEGQTVVFVVTSSIASIFFLYLIISRKWLKSRQEKISIAFVLGGTVGNLIDRIFFSGVRDFIYLKFIDFAIFNVADIMITSGVIMLCFCLLFKRKEKTND